MSLNFIGLINLLKKIHIAISRKVVGNKHQSARDKTERWSGYSLEFCIIDLEETYKFVFLHVENFVFPLRGLYL